MKSLPFEHDPGCSGCPMCSDRMRTLMDMTPEQRALELQMQQLEWARYHDAQRALSAAAESGEPPNSYALAFERQGNHAAARALRAERLEDQVSKPTGWAKQPRPESWHNSIAARFRQVGNHYAADRLEGKV